MALHQIRFSNMWTKSLSYDHLNLFHHSGLLWAIDPIQCLFCEFFKLQRSQFVSANPTTLSTSTRVHTYSRHVILEQLRTQHNKHLPEHNNNYTFIHSSSNSSMYIHELTFSATYSSGLNLKPIPQKITDFQSFSSTSLQLVSHLQGLLHFFTKGVCRLPESPKWQTGEPRKLRDPQISHTEKKRERGWDCVFILICLGMWIWIETKEHICIYTDTCYLQKARDKINHPVHTHFAHTWLNCIWATYLHTYTIL